MKAKDVRDGQVFFIERFIRRGAAFFVKSEMIYPGYLGQIWVNAIIVVKGNFSRDDAEMLISEEEEVFPINIDIR
jgi:hypothetical protein